MFSPSVSAASTAGSAWLHSGSKVGESVPKATEGQGNKPQNLYPSRPAEDSAARSSPCPHPKIPSRVVTGTILDQPIHPEILNGTPAGRWLKAHGAEQRSYLETADFIQTCEPSLRKQIIDLLAQEVFVMMENGVKMAPLILIFSGCDFNLVDEIVCTCKNRMDAYALAEEEFPIPCFVRPEAEFVQRLVPVKAQELLKMLTEGGLLSKRLNADWYPYRDYLRRRWTPNVTPLQAVQSTTSTSPSCCSLVTVATLSAVAAASLTYMWRQ